MTQIEFSPWFDVGQLSLDGLPRRSFVHQIKTASRLVDYPSGRSAMLFYGAGLTADAFPRVIQSVLEEFPQDELRIRFRPVQDVSQEVVRLLTRFEKRFGALPVFNTRETD